MLEKLYLGDILEKLPKAVRHIYTVIVVLIGWVFFYFTDLSAIKAFFAAAFGANGFADVTQNAIVTNYIVVLLVGAVFSVPVFSKILALGNRLCESTCECILCDFYFFRIVDCNCRLGRFKLQSVLIFSVLTGSNDDLFKEIKKICKKEYDAVRVVSARRDSGACCAFVLRNIGWVLFAQCL